MSTTDPGRRRALRGLLAAACFAAPIPAVAADEGARERREDFDALWSAIDGRYAYIAERRAAWKRVRAALRARAAAAASADDFVLVLEQALDELRDDHVSLSRRTPLTPRRVPQETDLWARWQDGVATIEAVRVAGDADYAGVRPGEKVARIDSLDAAQAVARRLGNARDASGRDRDWALRHVLAGPRAGTLALDLAAPEARHLEIVRNGRPPASQPPVLARRMGEERDLGYLRLKSPADERLAEHVDAAMPSLADTRALILDLRDATEGARETTRALLARFAKRDAPWQVRVSRSGQRVPDRVAAAGSPYTNALVVLVDRWTAGEGEALAAGLVAVAGARLVGTPMAGLRGELHEVRLPHSGIVARFPGEKVLHVDGTPRESLRPAVEIDPAAPSGGPGDPILYQALKLLAK